MVTNDWCIMLNYEAILAKEFTVAKPGDCNISLDIIACFRTRQLNQYIVTIIIGNDRKIIPPNIIIIHGVLINILGWAKMWIKEGAFDLHSAPVFLPQPCCVLEEESLSLGQENCRQYQNA